MPKKARHLHCIPDQVDSFYSYVCLYFAQCVFTSSSRITHWLQTMIITPCGSSHCRLQSLLLTIGRILCKHILAKLLTILLEYRLYELYLPEYSTLLTFNIIRTKLLFHFCNNKASSCHTYLMQFCQVRQQIPSLESKSRYRREGVTGTGFSRIHVTALVQITKRVVVVVYNIIDIIHLAQQCAFNIFLFS